MSLQLIPPDMHESIPLTEAAARLVKRGIEAARAGRSDEALKLFDEALAINEDDVEALLWRGALSMPNASLPFLERAVALAPGSRRAQDGLEWARQRVGLAAPAPAAQVRMRDTAARVGSAQSESPDVLRLSLPDFADVLGAVQTFMVKRQAAILLAIVMFLALLATGAKTRAGMATYDELAPDVQPASALDVAVTRAVPTATATRTAKSVAQAAPTATAGKATKSTSKVTPAPTVALLTLDQAWTAQDWPQAIAAIDRELQRLPGDPALIAKKLKAHYNYGMQLVSQDRLTDAVREFDKALAIDAMHADVQREKSHAILYRDGSEALADKDYDLAIPSLRTLFESAPGYREAKSRLYRAYLGYAAELEQSGKRSDAWTYFQKAVHVDAKGAEAETGLVRLKNDAPAAVKAGKKIEVDLTKQQVIVWENNQVRWRFKASTGVAKAPTRAGNFTVLTKMPYATNDALGWGMPYWLGIYQAGGTEDGFHAQLRLKNDTITPTSVLGRPYTNGCIMLSDQDEKTLYDWAEVGTPVWIHY